MEKKKQSSIEYYSNMVAEILGDEIVNKLSIEQTLRFSYLDKDVKAMHKEEVKMIIEHYHNNMFYLELTEIELENITEMIYKETFGGQDNE